MATKNMDLPEPLRTWDFTEQGYKEKIQHQKASIERLLQEREVLIDNSAAIQEELNAANDELNALREQLSRLEAGY